MVILLVSFGVLLVFGLKLSGKGKVVDSFKKQYEIRKRVEEVRHINMPDMPSFKNSSFFVTDSIGYLDSLLLYRVMIRDQTNKVVSFSDFYLTNEE